MYKQNSKDELKKVLALDTSCLLASYFTCNKAFAHSGTAYFTTDDGWSTFFFLKSQFQPYFLPRTTRGVELALGVGVCARAGVCAVDMDDMDAPNGVGSSSLFKT